ncbi:MAG: hypothetical protein JSW11_00465 [Candidatus Heimdallarchaeota archaeon]|nr:MAG: hypothetical protein JSW11_00465 [Candidatus Heimdallarchaeota archaeon]
MKDDLPKANANAEQSWEIAVEKLIPKLTKRIIKAVNNGETYINIYKLGVLEKHIRDIRILDMERII